MRKKWILGIVFTIIAISIIGMLLYYKGNDRKKASNENVVQYEETEVSEKVTDECTEEWEELEEEAKIELVEANSDQEKISPNCRITLKKYFTECQHTINEYTNIPTELVNKTKEELQYNYDGWKIEKFSSSEVILYRECNGQCGEHYILKDDSGKITIYRINEQNEEEVYEKTDISVDYLTDTDKTNIKSGIIVYSNEELNQIIEDFE